MRTAAVSSRTNPHLKKLRAAFAGNQRLSGGLVAIEGETLLLEAVRSGLHIDRVFVGDGIVTPGWLPSNVAVTELDPQLLRSAVDTLSPQGIAALVHPPAWALEQVCLVERSPLVLLAAGPQDPGNLGTLVRSAEAFGAACVLCLPGTVSPWNPKAIRSSAGSVFRTPVLRVSMEDLTGLQRRGLRLLAAAAEGSRERPSISASDADLTGACGLLIGNEGSGLDAAWLALADNTISIPMPGPVESLNAAVAGSLLLYEAARQRATPGPAKRQAAERKL